MVTRQARIRREVPVRRDAVRMHDEQRALRERELERLEFAHLVAERAVMRDEVPLAIVRVHETANVADARENALCRVRGNRRRRSGRAARRA